VNLSHFKIWLNVGGWTQRLNGAGSLTIGNALTGLGDPQNRSYSAAALIIFKVMLHVLAAHRGITSDESKS
jgi:hypothetical protein